MGNGRPADGGGGRLTDGRKMKKPRLAGFSFLRAYATCTDGDLLAYYLQKREGGREEAPLTKAG